jgi:hypothetical protein
MFLCWVFLFRSVVQFCARDPLVADLAWYCIRTLVAFKSGDLRLASAASRCQSCISALESNIWAFSLFCHRFRFRLCSCANHSIASCSKQRLELQRGELQREGSSNEQSSREQCSAELRRSEAEDREEQRAKGRGQRGAEGRGHLGQRAENIYKSQ